jgi:hypothetical protein
MNDRDELVGLVYSAARELRPAIATHGILQADQWLKPQDADHSSV